MVRGGKDLEKQWKQGNSVQLEVVSSCKSRRPDRGIDLVTALAAGKGTTPTREQKLAGYIPEGKVVIMFVFMSVRTNAGDILSGETCKE